MEPPSATAEQATCTEPADPEQLRQQQLDIALEHRRQRLLLQRAHDDAGDELASPAAPTTRTTRASQAAAAPTAAVTATTTPNTRSLRSRTRRDSRRRYDIGSDNNTPQSASPPSRSAGASASPSLGRKDDDVFAYVDDDELHIALEDALACITDAQAAEPRAVLADPAAALAAMRLVHTAMLLRFAARLNVGSRRGDDEDAENYDLFTHLCALFNCASHHVVAGILDGLAQRYSAALQQKQEAAEDADKADEQDAKAWEALPEIPIGEADEFVPFAAAVGTVPLDTPSKLRVVAGPVPRVVAACAVEQGAVLHVLRGVALKGERYADDALFLRGSCRSAHTYTVGCNFERTARINTDTDPVLRAIRLACACNASFYLVATAAPAGDASQARALAIIAESAIAEGEEVMLPQEMLWEACLEPPPCACAASTTKQASSPPPEGASAAGEAAVKDDPEAAEEAAEGSDKDGCALAEFFDLRSKLFSAVLESGAASLMGSESLGRTSRRQRQARKQAGAAKGARQRGRSTRRSSRKRQPPRRHSPDERPSEPATKRRHTSVPSPQQLPQQQDTPDGETPSRLS